MFPNLFQATQEYWRKLDELEKSYQQGEIPLKEVDARVAELMAELAQERRAAFAFLWHSCQHLVTSQRETLMGLAIVILLVYVWLLKNIIA